MFDIYQLAESMNPSRRRRRRRFDDLKRDPSLAPNKDLKKKKTKKIKNPKDLTFDDEEEELDSEPVSASEQLSYFFKQLESAIGVAVSSLDLEPIKDKCITELSESLEQDVSNLGEHINMSCGDSWRETLCEGEGNLDPGNPYVLVLIQRVSHQLCLRFSKFSR